jgi:hypothetical protein
MKSYTITLIIILSLMPGWIPFLAYIIICSILEFPVEYLFHKNYAKNQFYTTVTK